MLLTSEAQLKFWRDVRWQVVAATGCFDVLHVGHLRLLQYARSLGQFLVVGINSDESVRKLKGPNRPVNNERDRADMLLGLSCVDAVYIFNDLRCSQFLRCCYPSVWVKGGDYTLETLDQAERYAVEDAGGTIRFFRTVDGHSTTSTLAKLELADK